MQTLVIHLPDTGKSPASPSAEVRFTLTPTALAVELNTSAECRSSASAFNHVSTAAEPGNNVDSLTWAALKRYQFRYKHQIQQTASTTWPPMEFCPPNLETGIATLCFDKLECGHPCAVEDTATGKVYTRMRVVNNDGTLGAVTDLKFTSGSALLVA